MGFPSHNSHNCEFGVIVTITSIIQRMKLNIEEIGESLLTALPVGEPPGWRRHP